MLRDQPPPFVPPPLAEPVKTRPEGSDWAHEARNACVDGELCAVRDDGRTSPIGYNPPRSKPRDDLNRDESCIHKSAGKPREIRIANKL
jgi:hypothetical protein